MHQQKAPIDGSHHPDLKLLNAVCDSASCCPLALDVPLPFTRRNFLLFAQHWPQDPTGGQLMKAVTNTSLDSLEPRALLSRSGAHPAALSHRINLFAERRTATMNSSCPEAHQTTEEVVK
ncbi:hypothetical protein NQZ68_002955 [Dissostichus eleginoides]|nr:hypothetical protein NQZ68_002955 [Dissostichus eleginoides]